MSLDTILSVGYVLFGVITFRLVMRAVIADLSRGPYSRIEWDDVVLAACVGLAGGLLWPPCILFILLARFAPDPKRAARIVAGESRATKARRLEDERRERERYIQQLERELELERVDGT